MNTPHNVCFLHGWAANHHIFDHLIKELPNHDKFNYQAWDLPGHGTRSDEQNHFDVVKIADEFAHRLHDKTHLVGWSLGGLIAMYIAERHPEKVASLVLTSTFPKLLRDDDYSAGLKNPAIDKMADLFPTDYAKYMKQFLQLQFLYRKEQSGIIDQLMPSITQYGSPGGLISALECIHNSDARAILANIKTPCCLIFGNKDAITPVAMGQYLHEHIPHNELNIVDQAAHAVFLSHESEFIEIMTEFWNKQS